METQLTEFSFITGSTTYTGVATTTLNLTYSTYLIDLLIIIGLLLFVDLIRRIFTRRNW